MISEFKNHLKVQEALFFGLCLLFSTGISAQNTGKTQIMAEAVNMLDKANKADNYLYLEDGFRTLAQREPSQWLPYYYIAYCNVRLGFLSKDDKKKNKSYSDAALEAIKQAKARCRANSPALQAEVYNVYSMAYRVLIAAKPMINGRKFGSIANDLLEKALKLSPQNPRSLYLSGQVKYLTPTLFGGDKKKAKELLMTALKGFNEQQSDPVLPRWGKKDCELLISKIK